MNGNKCQAGCSDGKYFNGVQCAPCNSPCVTCEGGPSYCTKCPTGMYAYKGQCTTTCPTTIVNGNCGNFCPDGLFLSGTSCQKCSTSCNTCSTVNFCTSCKGTLLNYKGQCLTTCPTNTIASSGGCLDCDQYCSGCSGSISSCINCVTGAYRLA